jgi:hypothetical protein
VKAQRVVRRPGSHIFYAISSQMAVRLSALRAGRFLPPRKIPGTQFCQRLSRPQGHSEAGRIRSIEKCDGLIGNGTRDLAACSLNELRFRVHTHESIDYTSLCTLQPRDCHFRDQSMRFGQEQVIAHTSLKKCQNLLCSVTHALRATRSWAEVSACSNSES